MITGLDHIAIAVPDLERAISRFMHDFGLEFGGREDVAEAQTSAAFFPLPPTRIELVHPLAGQGAVARYLEKHPGGLHHLCFRSDDLDADVARLRGLGYEFTTEAPQAGAHGCCITEWPKENRKVEERAPAIQNIFCCLCVVDAKADGLDEPFELCYSALTHRRSILGENLPRRRGISLLRLAFRCDREEDASAGLREATLCCSAWSFLRSC